jgi:hypothetical protein
LTYKKKAFVSCKSLNPSVLTDAMMLVSHTEKQGQQEGAGSSLSAHTAYSSALTLGAIQLGTLYKNAEGCEAKI